MTNQGAIFFQDVLSEVGLEWRSPLDDAKGCSTGVLLSKCLSNKRKLRSQQGWRGQGRLPVKMSFPKETLQQSWDGGASHLDKTKENSKRFPNPDCLPMLEGQSHC